MSDRIGIPVLSWEICPAHVRMQLFARVMHEEARSQVVTRLIDLFVDIAVLLKKLVYRFSGTYSSSPPDSWRVAGHVYHAATEMSSISYGQIFLRQRYWKFSAVRLSSDLISRFHDIIVILPNPRWHSNIFCTPIFVLGQDESQGTTTENSG